MKAKLKSTGEIIEVEGVFYGKADHSPFIPSDEIKIIQESPWINTKDQLPIPEIEYIEGIEYGSIDVLGAIQSSHGTCYCICRYWGYDKEYRWENGIAPDCWMPIPKFNE